MKLKVFAITLMLLNIFTLTSCKDKKTTDTSAQSAITSSSSPSEQTAASSDIKLENSVSSNSQTSKNETSKASKPKKESEKSSTETSYETLEEISNIKIVKKYNPNIFSAQPNFDYKIFYDEQSGNKMPYRLYLPSKISKDKKYPVILFLHGAGEIGTDNQSHLGNFSQCFNIANDLLEECIIICPQTPAGWNIDQNTSGDKNGYLSIAKRILDLTIKEYNADPDRIYLTGLSLGSFATWNMLREYPYFFAAAVPVCGGGGSMVSQSIIDTPIWIFHGTADPTVNYESSNITYNAIISAGGKKVKFTTLPGVQHNAWDYAYTDREMFSWLLSQNKTKNPDAKYEYSGKVNIISQDGKVIIDEKDIVNAWNVLTINGEYLEVYISDTADSLLRKTYNNNPKQTFSFEIFNKKVYDFQFKEYPKNNMIRIEKTVDDNTFSEIVRIIETSY